MLYLHIDCSKARLFHESKGIAYMASMPISKRTSQYREALTKSNTFETTAIVLQDFF